MKILQVSFADIAGGAEKIAFTLFKAYRDAGHDSWLAVGRKHTHDSNVLKIEHDRYRSAWAQSWIGAGDALKQWEGKFKGPGRLRRIAHAIAEPRRALSVMRGLEDFEYPGTAHLLDLPPNVPDIVHCHNLHFEYFDLRQLPWLSRQVPVVITMHDAWLLTGHCAYPLNGDGWKTDCQHCNDLSLHPKIRRDATAFNWQRKKEIYARSRFYIATPCRWLMSMVEQSMLMPAIIDRRIVPNGIDLTTFHPGDRHEARAALNLPSDATILLFAANGIRGNAYKDYATIRAAVARVAQELSDRRVLCVALGEDAPDEQVGRAMIRFVPFQNDPRMVAKFYQAADLYLHAARADTFPNVVLESLACGTPVVATAVGGIPEQIRDRETGLLVAPQNPSEMSDAAVKLLRGDSMCRTLSENGARDARERFDIERQRDDYLSWYGEILQHDVSTARAFRRSLHPGDAVRSAVPKISVVTTSFNQGQFLQETIDSVLSQNYPNLEYIIIDGGSTDQSVDIIRKHASHLAFWISEKDRGQSHALNKGFARATGEIFAFINSDDFYEPGALAKMADAMARGASGAKWVAGNVRYHQAGVGDWPLPPYPAKSRPAWLLFCPIPQPGCFWSAELSHRHGPFREDLQCTMDYEFWLRLRFEEGIVPQLLDEPIAVYRLHEQSKTMAQNQRFAEEARLLRREYAAKLTFAERMKFWILRRHRKAHRQAVRARDLARNGHALDSARQLATAYFQWPPLLGDPRGLAAANKLLRGHSHTSPLPFAWVDPDD